MNFGGRFSMNAVTASVRSLDCRNPAFQTATYSRPSAIALSFAGTDHGLRSLNDQR